LLPNHERWNSEKECGVSKADHLQRKKKNKTKKKKKKKKKKTQKRDKNDLVRELNEQLLLIRFTKKASSTLSFATEKKKKSESKPYMSIKKNPEIFTRSGIPGKKKMSSTVARHRENYVLRCTTTLKKGGE